MALATKKTEMLERVLSFPAQVAEAYKLGKDLVFPWDRRDFSSIVVLGMGGSGIVGEFLRVLLGDSNIPIYASRNSSAPKFVNEDSLVLAISYSGKTQETLDALAECVRSNAKVIALTTSGKNELNSICSRNAIPLIKIPENGHSRFSLGYLLIPVLCVLENAKIINHLNDDVREATRVLNEVRRQCGPKVPLERNQIKSLAFDLVSRFPIIYGEQNFTDAAALRWKQMFNENSKIHCYYDTFPELVHNEIETWYRDEGNDTEYMFILLRDSEYEQHLRLSGRIEAAKSILNKNGFDTCELWSRGKSELSRLLSLSYLGDLASVYLARARGINSCSVDNIETIKREYA